MKRASRFAKGKTRAEAPVYRDDSGVQKIPWKNPLKGDDRKSATAEVKVAKGGVIVNVLKMRF
jgi:hypothetical protein